MDLIFQINWNLIILTYILAVMNGCKGTGRNVQLLNKALLFWKMFDINTNVNQHYMEENYNEERKKMQIYIIIFIVIWVSLKRIRNIWAVYAIRPMWLAPLQWTIHFFIHLGKI